MKRKMTISELRTFIQERVITLVKNKISEERIIKEGVEDLEKDMMMVADQDGRISGQELQDIAVSNGVDMDDEAFLRIYTAVRNRLVQMKEGELKDDVQFVIDTYFEGQAPDSFTDFYEVFATQHFDHHYGQSDVFNAYKTMTTNPNQLAMFESKLYEMGFDQNGNPYGFEEDGESLDTYHGPSQIEPNVHFNDSRNLTIKKPIIPDALKVLSKNKDAIKVNSKSEFDTIAGKQGYFSASYSYCFYTPEEYEAWTNKHAAPSEDAVKSVMLFNTGRELVQIWDERNQIGYIVPGQQKTA